MAARVASSTRRFAIASPVVPIVADFGQCSRNHAARRARIITKDTGNDVRDKQTGRGDDCRDSRLGQPILAQALKELRAAPIADGKQEQHEEALLDLRRDLYAELAYQYAREQRASDRAE